MVGKEKLGVGVVERLDKGLTAEGVDDGSGQSVMSATSETAWKLAKEIMGLKFDGPECRVRSGFGSLKLDSKADSCWLVM